MNHRDRQILRIALPSIVSNITVPLLGLIDVAIVGHMGDAVYIGAVAVGSMIFSLTYWLFGFLRMSTSGLAAQAFGRRDLREDALILLRSTVVAVGVALLLLLFQVPLLRLAFLLIGPTADVSPMAEAYFRIVVWGAPAVLCLYSLMGWFIGMQNTRIPMFVSIFQNVANVAASLTLVYGLGLRVEGVAIGTVVAQYAGLGMAAVMLKRYYGGFFTRGCGVKKSCQDFFTRGCAMKTLWQPVFFRRFFAVNRDLFLRTLCLVGVNLFFTAVGARSGPVILSVNTVLMQFYLFFSYFMDGFANAGEAIGGRYFGAGDRTAFASTLRRLFGWAAIITAAFTLLYLAGGMVIVTLLTDEPQVVAAARRYIGWACVVPVAGAAAFIWDGVFVGITATRGMLVASAVAAAAFFAVYLAATHTPSAGRSLLPGNHALWLAQVVFLAMRGTVQTLWYNFSETGH